MERKINPAKFRKRLEQDEQILNQVSTPGSFKERAKKAR